MEVVPFSDFVLTANANGYITVENPFKFYVDMRLWVSNNGLPQQECVVTEVDKTTATIGIRTTGQYGYGRSDLTAYVGGTIDVPKQFLGIQVQQDGEFSGDVTVSGAFFALTNLNIPKYPTSSLPTPYAGQLAYDTTQSAVVWSNGSSWSLFGSSNSANGTVQAICNPSLQVGDLVVATGDLSGTPVVQKADPVNPSLFPAIGMAVSKSTSTVAEFLSFGLVSGHSGLSVGKVFMGLDGRPTNVCPAPTVQDSRVRVQIIGMAISENRLMLSVSPQGVILVNL